jgi:Protein of unknown function (DUF1236)
MIGIATTGSARCDLRIEQRVPHQSYFPRQMTDKDREIIRKHARSSRTEQRTTGSNTTTTRARVGERLPESVEIRSFPETVYRESPSLREYRYIERDNRTYVIEPRTDDH